MTKVRSPPLAPKAIKLRMSSSAAEKRQTTARKMLQIALKCYKLASCQCESWWTALMAIPTRTIAVKAPVAGHASHESEHATNTTVTVKHSFRMARSRSGPMGCRLVSVTSSLRGCGACQGTPEDHGDEKDNRCAEQTRENNAPGFPVVRGEDGRVVVEQRKGIGRQR